jgi:ABC-type sugar transport system ATPase subunit
MTETQGEPVLRAAGLRKRYGHVEAMRHVEVVVDYREIVGVVGDNGAGKSTFVKTVAGVHEPDGGQLFIDGDRVSFRSPNDAHKAGIEVVHQDLALAPDLPVWANLFLGRPLRARGALGGAGWLDKRTMRRQAVEQLEKLHIRLKSVDAPVEDLSGGQRQAVAVARGVAWGRKLIVLDEPTNNLGVPEQLEVLALVKRLAEEGLGVLMISHNLEHVFRIADRIVVFRHGITVASTPIKETTHEQVIGWITGLHPAPEPTANGGDGARDDH